MNTHIEQSLWVGYENLYIVTRKISINLSFPVIAEHIYWLMMIKSGVAGYL